MYHGALAEAAVAFVNFLFAGLVGARCGVMEPYAGAFFYVVRRRQRCFVRVSTRGLHSSTFQLNLSRF